MGRVGSRGAMVGMSLMRRMHSEKTAGTWWGEGGEEEGVEGELQWGMGRRRREAAEARCWVREKRMMMR